MRDVRNPNLKVLDFLYDDCKDGRGQEREMKRKETISSSKNVTHFWARLGLYPTLKTLKTSLVNSESEFLVAVPSGW